MNYGGDAADQVVRYYLEGVEYTLRLSGTAAKNFAVFALAVLKDQRKIHGKTNLVRLLREGKPMRFFTVPKDRMHDFARSAKSHGLLYVPIRDKNDPDNIEIAILQDDAAKVNRIIDKLQLDTVEAGSADIVEDVQDGLTEAHAETQTVETKDGAVSFEVGESEELFGLGFTPPAEEEVPVPDKPLSENSSLPSAASPVPLPTEEGQTTDPGSADRIRAKGKTPSVRLELGELKATLLTRKEQQFAPELKRPVKINRTESWVM